MAARCVNCGSLLHVQYGDMGGVYLVCPHCEQESYLTFEEIEAGDYN